MIQFLGTYVIVMVRFMLETPKVTSRGMTFDSKVNLAINVNKDNLNTHEGLEPDPVNFKI